MPAPGGSTAAKASQEAAAMVTDSIVVERDDGLFQLGLCDDAAGPFASRQHAADVAKEELRRAAA